MSLTFSASVDFISVEISKILETLSLTSISQRTMAGLDSVRKRMRKGAEGDTILAPVTDYSDSIAIGLKGGRGLVIKAEVSGVTRMAVGDELCDVEGLSLRMPGVVVIRVSRSTFRQPISDG